MLLTELFLLSQHWVFCQSNNFKLPKAFKDVCRTPEKQECSESLSIRLLLCCDYSHPYYGHDHTAASWKTPEVESPIACCSIESFHQCFSFQFLDGARYFPLESFN
jgi:hypothetical protein